MECNDGDVDSWGAGGLLAAWPLGFVCSTRGGGVSVLAAKAMQVGELRMAPLITGGSSLSRFSQTASAGFVLQVRVTRGDVTSEWHLNGSGSLPSASMAVEHSDKEVTKHNWLAGHNPWPLWFIKRVNSQSESNCSFEDMVVRTVSTFQATEAREGGDAFAANEDIVVPVLVNTKAVAKGDELRVHWMPKMKSSKSARADEITWATQARQKLGKQQRQK